jgi:hypothetical protein
VEFKQLPTQPHQWQCYQLILHAGHYNSLDFIAEPPSNDYAYIGLDSIHLVELDGVTCACPVDSMESCGTTASSISTEMVMTLPPLISAPGCGSSDYESSLNQTEFEEKLAADLLLEVGAFIPLIAPPKAVQPIIGEQMLNQQEGDEFEGKGSTGVRQ